nr:isoform c of glycogenin-1 [Quercus suber]
MRGWSPSITCTQSRLKISRTVGMSIPYLTDMKNRRTGWGKELLMFSFVSPPASLSIQTRSLLAFPYVSYMYPRTFATDVAWEMMIVQGSSEIGSSVTRATVLKSGNHYQDKDSRRTGEGQQVFIEVINASAVVEDWGAAVVAHSLRDAGTKKKLACLIHHESLRASTVKELQSLYDHVITIDRIGNPQPANLYLMNRPDLLYTFTKINLWRQTQFRKIVYIDADVVALRAPDELFDLPDTFAAAPDVGWPDIFNTGVMVLTPHMGDFWALQTLANAGDSFDGADQGLLNQYFEHKPWKRLSFTYNCTPSGSYQYEPAYRYFKSNIKMVHFIGSQKPWQHGRTAHSTGGSYQELLSRWWAVYDRHFKISTYEYAELGQWNVRPGAVQVGTDAAVERPVAKVDVPMTEKHDGILELVEEQPQPERTVFAAPQMQWDATRSAPPAESKPEAANFPSQIYEFNNDPKPFRPPHSYAEPPRDMYYSVPSTKPKKEASPPAIFPWEERKQKPTRIWVDDEPEPAPIIREPELDLEATGLDEFGVTMEKDENILPSTPAIKIDEAPWQSFGAVNKNVWDDVSGIGEYVRALTAAQKKRGGVQVLSTTDTSKAPTQILSPDADTDPSEFMERANHRRESLILTDFPSQIERPSLPVTPAPIRRQNFWSGERDGEGDLPPAEGVPEQADWDPNAQLEQLRKNSLIETMNITLPDRTMKSREMPRSAQLVTQPGDDESQPSGAAQSSSRTESTANDTTTTSTRSEANSSSRQMLSETSAFTPSLHGTQESSSNASARTDWDPNAQLEQLRKNSLMENMNINLSERTMESREMPQSAGLLTSLRDGFQLSGAGASNFQSRFSTNDSASTSERSGMSSSSRQDFGESWSYSSSSQEMHRSSTNSMEQSGTSQSNTEQNSTERSDTGSAGRGIL